MPVLKGPPPFSLIQLSNVPEERWLGLAVFHPMGGQAGDIANWADENGDAAYDTGVVYDWKPDPDFADLGAIRVFFVCDSGSVLFYDATNLWTPVAD